MPTAFDLGKYTTDYSPIAGGPFVSIQDVMSSFGDVFQEIISLFPQLLNLIEQLNPSEILQIVETGLTQFLPQFLDQLFPTDGTTSPLITAVVNALGGGSSGGAGNIVPQLIQVATTLLPELAAQLETVLTNPGNLLAGFTTGGMTLLQQLISAGGGNTGATNLFTEFASIFGGGGGSGLPAIFTSGLNTSASLLSQLPSLLTLPLSSLGTGTLPSGISLGTLSQVPGLSGLLSGLDTTGATTLLVQLGSLLTLPLSAITGLVGAGGLLSGFTSGTSILPQLANMLFNTTGSTNSTLGVGGANLLALLGNPAGLLSGSFDPVAAGTGMLETVLTPAGALSTLTQVPSHLLGNLTGIPSAIEQFIPVGWTGSFNNLLPDPNFTNPASLDQTTVWTWDGSVTNGVTGAGSATTTVNGLLKELMGVPVKTAPTQTHFGGMFVKWTGLSAGSGTVIELLANAFDANDNLLSITPVSGVASPGASSAGYSGTDSINSLKTLAANSNNLVLLSGTVQAPANTMYMRFSTRITNVATAGQVWLTGGIHAMQGVLDAGAIGNVSNMPLLPNTNVQGIQGIADIGTSLGHTLDQFMNALNNTTGATNSTIAAVSNALNDLVNTANQALTIAQQASGMVGSIPTNFNNAGPAALTIPTNMQVSGRKFDLVCLGGGGAGDGEYGAPYESPGGSPGLWAGVTVTYGTEIPLGTTTLTVNVGTGGQGATGYYQNGTNGNPTTIKLPSGTTLLSAAGGTHGANSQGPGNGPGNFTWNGVSYPGGANVVNGANGSAPGGAGSGALPFSTTSGNGAPGYAGIVMRTP